MRRLLKLKRADTLASAFARYQGIGPGFDLLRIGLALLIFIGHAKWASGSAPSAIFLEGFDPVAPALPAGVAGKASDEWVGVTRGIKLALVPMFFALSGYLVMGSAVRLRNVPTFLAHRLLRIFPALIVEVSLSAIVLGALFSSLPLRDYFSHPEFFRYLANAAGFITMVLPGVFLDNPVPGIVNVNLWTLPAELYCYLIICALMLTRSLYNRAIYTVLFVMTYLVLAWLHYFWGISRGTPYPPHVVTLYFFTGVLMFHWADRIPASIMMGSACAVASYLFLMDSRLAYLAPLPLTYLTIFTGLVRIPPIPLLKTGDYSYGIYLYGFPITQALVAAIPAFVGHPIYPTVSAVAASGVFAAASWHLIEKRVLKMRHRLPERWFPSTPRERIAAA